MFFPVISVRLAAPFAMLTVAESVELEVSCLLNSASAVVELPTAYMPMSPIVFTLPAEA